MNSLLVRLYQSELWARKLQRDLQAIDPYREPELPGVTTEVVYCVGDPKPIVRRLWNAASYTRLGGIAADLAAGMRPLSPAKVVEQAPPGISVEVYRNIKMWL